MTATAESARLPRAAETEISVSLRVLVLIRWVAVIGQAAAVLVAHYVFGFALPIVAALVAVATSAALNIVATMSHRVAARLGGREAGFYLAYDTLQLGALLFLTGGLQNPFAILMLAPVTVSATILTRRSVIGLSALTVAALSVLALFHLPLPSRADMVLTPAPLYVFGMWAALVSSTLFIAGYTWWVAEEARRMRDAFTATQLALAREQRISAVGGLAAAAAHQLGSPLATIAVVAKELVRDLPADSPYADDAELLLSQSERCRTILAELSRQREDESGGHFVRVPFSALVEMAGEAHGRTEISVTYAAAPGRDSEGEALDEPLVARSPEIMHGLNNLIQNAMQFAQHEVSVTINWDAATVTVEIADDGPGFPAHLLGRLGEPYLSTRAGDADHMGLGIFIAQSLLERTGARIDFANVAEGGAEIVVEWRRSAFPTQELRQPMRETSA